MDFLGSRKRRGFCQCQQLLLLIPLFYLLLSGVMSSLKLVSLWMCPSLLDELPVTWGRVGVHHEQALCPLSWLRKPKVKSWKWHTMAPLWSPKETQTAGLHWARAEAGERVGSSGLASHHQVPGRWSGWLCYIPFLWFSDLILIGFLSDIYARYTEGPEHTL